MSILDFSIFPLLNSSNWLSISLITFKYLEKTLSEVIKSETQVKLIMEHIKQKRTVKIVQEIKRFSNN